MTRHNLAGHISWLLSHKVAPPEGVHTALPSYSRTEEEVAVGELLEEEADEEIIRSPQNPAQNRHVLDPVNAVRDFARPSIAPSIIPRSQMLEPQRSFADGTMGTLSSASKSSRPGLWSQHPLATPASTTASTTPSSLTQSYKTFLKNSHGEIRESYSVEDPQLTDKGTPSSKPGNNAPVPPLMRSMQTPQTPRQTPRPTIEVKTETVDLTGEDHSENLTSRSSSEEGFGEPIPLWREDSASRAEPKASKKRKSDEISLVRAKRTNLNISHSVNSFKDHDTGLDDFVDIDDVMPRSQKNSTSIQTPLSTSVRPSIEKIDSGNGFEEDVMVTGTTRRVETRTRKDFSLVPSINESIDTDPTQLRQTRTPVSLLAGSKAILFESGAAVQVSASPVSQSFKYPNRAVLTPQRRHKRQFPRIVQDSEDDEGLSDIEKRASCSPRVPVKNSPRKLGIASYVNWRAAPPFEPSEPKYRDVKQPNSRTSSPLRQISENVKIKNGNVLSPFQRDSPTKLSVPTMSSKQISSQQTPTSSFGLDDKELAIFYLKHPSAISIYQQRVQNVLGQNSIASMKYMDDGEVAPAHLKEERQTLLNMSKAYKSLEELAGHWQGVTAEKKKLVDKIAELVDFEDVSSLEERSASLSRDRQKIEKEIVRLLHASGAVQDGFGTGSDTTASKSTHRDTAKVHDNAVPLPSGSSIIGSAQVIMQTQFPALALAPKSTPVATQGMRDEQINKYSSRDSIPTTLPVHPSPTPIRANQACPIPPRQQSTTYQNDWTSPNRGMKQPDFYRDPSPIDYGVEADDDLFVDLLREKHEIHNDADEMEEVPDGMEDDDYGDSDDYEEMLEAAQEAENRHSLPQSFSNRTGRSTPDSSKRNRTSVKRNMYSHIDPAHAGLLRHPWSDDVKKALKDRFKLTGFRYHQLDAINATLKGDDAFVLMPTGGGKSLCYQLPAVVQSGKTKGITIVISPLLSLMNDQVQHLRKINIRAATLNSETTSEERSEIYNNLKEAYPEQYIQLLYITPEMITKSTAMLNTFSRLHRTQKLARIVIDEAHCVSQWGHDFRPDYVALGNVRKQFPNVPIMALTATATENVKLDVMHQLGMEDCPVYSQSFNRPNLFYEVRKKKGRGTSKDIVAEMVELITVKYKNQSGIIYTLSRKGTESLAETLRKDHRIKAHHYHADIPVPEKTRVQKEWQSGKIQVVVATIAFGMGIDKADVRFVIHDTVPKSLEGYYQETGRAGRDGKRAGCYLYYGYSDTAALKRFIYENDASPEQKERQRTMLANMIQYCENRSDCRRVQVLAYFGEKFTKDECDHTCDNCSSGKVFKLVDFTEHARAAMRIVKQLQNDNVTLIQCMDIIRGATTTATKKIKEKHDKIEGSAIAKDVARNEVERLFSRLLLENALAEHNVVKGGFATQYIHLGPKCRGFMTGERKVQLQVQVSASPPVKQRVTKSTKPQSTMVSSPAPQRKKPANRYGDDEDGDADGDDNNDFVVSDDDDAFEPMPNRRHRRKSTAGQPISEDQEMAGLADVHRVFILQFVDAAKRLEEVVRNRKGLRKALFTEMDFRQMAIRWTLTSGDMMNIPGINKERVRDFGQQFARLVNEFHTNYNQAMSDHDDRDMDPNHKNIIDLISDEDENENEDDYDIDDGDEEAMLAAEEGSKYFNKPSDSGDTSSRHAPWSAGGGAKSSSSRGGGSSFRGKGRGGKKAYSRRSNGSASGTSTSGISKRRASGGAKKSRASKASSGPSSKQSSLFQQYGNGGAGGMGGGGIGMMPT